jgi:hypothetical protein
MIYIENNAHRGFRLYMPANGEPTVARLIQPHLTFSYAPTLNTIYLKITVTESKDHFTLETNKVTVTIDKTGRRLIDTAIALANLEFTK